MIQPGLIQVFVQYFADKRRSYNKYACAHSSTRSKNDNQQTNARTWTLCAWNATRFNTCSLEGFRWRTWKIHRTLDISSFAAETKSGRQPVLCPCLIRTCSVLGVFLVAAARLGPSVNLHSTYLFKRLPGSAARVICFISKTYTSLRALVNICFWT